MCLILKEYGHNLVAAAVLTNAVSLRGKGHPLGHTAATHTYALALSLRIYGYPHGYTVAPAVAYVHRIAVTPHDLLHIVSQAQQRVDIVAHKSDLDRRVGHGREFEERRAQPYVGTRRQYKAVETLLHRLGRTFVVNLDQYVAEVGTRRDAAAGKIVPYGGRPRRCRYVHNLGL